jgi:hypothetical protein
MGPYTKSQTATAIDDGWEIKDVDGGVIAITETETLANMVMACLKHDCKPVVSVALTDQGDGTGTTDVTVTACGRGKGYGCLLIDSPGYGDYGSADGYGTPVLIERYNNELRVIVYADINQEDATHVTSLEGARETKRLPDETARHQNPGHG